MIVSLDRWTDRREEAKKTSKDRDYRDVEYRKLSGNTRTVLMDAYCKKTGHWLGRYEILAPYFKDDVLTPTAHNYLESVLIKSKVISSRECDLDVMLMSEVG